MSSSAVVTPTGGGRRPGRSGTKGPQWGLQNCSPVDLRGSTSATCVSEFGFGDDERGSAELSRGGHARHLGTDAQARVLISHHGCNSFACVCQKRHLCRSNAPTPNHLSTYIYEPPGLLRRMMEAWSTIWPRIPAFIPLWWIC